MYKIIGSNQVEYGPITADQLRAWIAEGRVNGQTAAQAEGETTWRSLSTFPEFASSFPATPPTAPGPLGTAFNDDGRAGALALIGPPAITLIVVTAIGIAFMLLLILLGLLGLGAHGLNNFGSSQNPEVARWMRLSGSRAGFGVAMMVRLLGIFLGVWIIYGANKMKKLESYGMSMAVCIVAMLPCLSPCCWLGLPVGIWALVTLNQSQVKPYFKS